MLMSSFIDILYPRRCPVCDGIVAPLSLDGAGKIVTGKLIHESCAKKVKYIKGSTCVKCGKKLTGAYADMEYCADCRKHEHIYDRGFAIFDYRSIAGSIYRFKYAGRQEYASFYADRVRRMYGKKLKKLGIEAIIPVPMYREKEKQRGYNQALVFAKEVSRQCQIPIYKDLIIRRKNTRPMKELDVRGRRNNLKKAFNIVRNDVEFKCILIIDDIYTTGSTIDEIAHEFRIAGVERIYFLSLAIGQTT